MTAIPTYRVTQPSGATAYWLYANSDTSQVIGTDGNGDRQRCIVWDIDGGQSEALYSGRNMYALTGMKFVSNTTGRTLNWHCQPNDQPYGYIPIYKEGGISSKGVSPIAVDLIPSVPTESQWDGLQFKVECNSGTGNGTGRKFWSILTMDELAARAGQWIWVWTYIRWGRTALDGAPVTGALKCWVAGEDDTPRIDASGINTHWYGQHQVTFWQGGYWAGGGPGYTVDHVLTRFGRTPQECYEDVPVLLYGSGAGQAGGGDVGSHTALTSRQHDEAAIPQDIDWNVGGGGTPPPDPTLPANTRDRRFGKTAPGVDRATLTGNFKRASKFPTGLGPGEEADIYDFHLFVGGNDLSSSTQSLTFAVYDSDGDSGGPGTKIGECDDEIQVAGNAEEGWQKATATTPIRVSSEEVWIAIGSSTPTARLKIATDQSVTDGLYANADTYDASAPRLADPFGTADVTDNELSVAADYDVVEPTAATPERSTVTRTTSIARISNISARVVGGDGGGV